MQTSSYFCHLPETSQPYISTLEKATVGWIRSIKATVVYLIILPNWEAKQRVYLILASSVFQFLSFQLHWSI